MTDIDGLIERLRSLSRAEHDDISIGDEAATALADLRAKLEAAELRIDYLERVRKGAESLAAIRKAALDASGTDLSRLRALLVEAGGWLKPFNDGWEKFKHCVPDDGSQDNNYPGSWVTNGHFRHAAALARKIEQEKATWPTG